MTNVVVQSDEVVNLGPGYVFRVQKDGRIWPAFIIRYEEQALAYLNACAHVGLKLNGNKNEFFDRSGKSLMCQAHGAVYDAATGKCKDGPCQGYGLIPLAIREEKNLIYYEDEVYTLVVE